MAVLTRNEVELQCLKALGYLAGLCDGAVEQDGVGFNGADSAFGKSLAKQSRLSDKQLAAAAKMLQKYQGQLEVVMLPLPSVLDVERLTVSKDCVAAEAGGNSAKPKPKPIKKLVAACLPGAADQMVEVEVEVEITPTSIEVLGVERAAAEPGPEPISAKPWLKSEHREMLNDQQRQAFDAAHEWYFSRPTEPFVLIGRSGSGKSYTAQRIVKSLQEITAARAGGRKLKIALTAPTHRARAVLEKFAAAADVACHISTVQSLLFLKPGKADKDGKRRLEINEYKWMKRDRDPHWSDFNLVITDECSMASDELYQFIRDQPTPVLFMGESYQLPPIENDTDEEKLSPVFDLNSQCKLTKVMRYDGKIAEFVDAMADKIEFSKEELPKLRSYDCGGNLVRLGDKETWESVMLEMFQSGEQCRALAWTNTRVEELNKLIRHAVMGVSAQTDPFVSGDRVMAKEPIMFEQFDPAWYKWVEGSLMQTCDEGVITEVFPTIRDIRLEADHNVVNWSEQELKALAEFFPAQGEFQPDLIVPSLNLTIECDSQEIVNVQVITGDTLELVGRAAKSLKRTATTSDDEKEKRAHWRAYYHLLDAFSVIEKNNRMLQRLQFAFASTVHQAQGGTYDYVFCDHVNMMGCRQPFVRDRLIYTAVSRAAKQMIAYSKS